ncbi:MAG TPA: superoxide dismutase family protein [Papillibacter sp.]|jgi:Cu-Zn family superoxide dismutase|nr:superoxide dismutase family protein [Papillibacter sp.]
MLWSVAQRAKKYIRVLTGKPDAKAILRGGPSHPNLYATVKLYQTGDGVLVCAEAGGLPDKDGACSGGVFGFHIHEGTSCTGTAADPFADTKGHFNPDGCRHPYHAGDMPPLFSSGGRAFLVFLTNRFKVRDVVGRTVVIHAGRDDFTTQPSGDSGKKIACGVITA